LTFRIVGYKLDIVINFNPLNMLELLKELERLTKSLDKDIDKLKLDIEELKDGSEKLKELTIK
jgi:hypothetical protein